MAYNLAVERNRGKIPRWRAPLNARALGRQKEWVTSRKPDYPLKALTRAGQRGSVRPGCQGW